MRRKRRWHKPAFKAKVVLTAIRGEMVLAERVEPSPEYLHEKKEPARLQTHM